MKKKVTVEIEFDDDVVANHFLQWLSGSGEQEYWQWMECREEREKGKITAVAFDYHTPNGSKKFGPRVSTTSGRLDDEE